MRKLSIILAVLLSLFAYSAQAKNDPESKVEITLKETGDVLKGEMHDFWYGPFKKEQNKSFTIIDDSGNKVKLTADDVSTVNFVNDPEASQFEASNIAMPGLSDSKRILHWMLGISDRSEHATVYWWNYLNSNDVHFGSTGTMPGTWWIRTEKAVCYGLKIEGSDVVYPFYYPGNGGLNFAVMNLHLKNSNPQWVAYLKEYLKKNKGAKKQLKANPGYMLDIYESFIKEDAK